MNMQEMPCFDQKDCSKNWQRATFQALTDRGGVEVLALIARGLSNKDIARVLAASEFTVKAHVRNVLAKLGVETRTEAAILAVQRGLVQI